MKPRLNFFRMNRTSTYWLSRTTFLFYVLQKKIWTGTKTIRIGHFATMIGSLAELANSGWGLRLLSETVLWKLELKISRCVHYVVVHSKVAYNKGDARFSGCSNTTWKWWQMPRPVPFTQFMLLKKGQLAFFAISVRCSRCTF